MSLYKTTLPGQGISMGKDQQLEPGQSFALKLYTMVLPGQGKGMDTDQLKGEDHMQHMQQVQHIQFLGPVVNTSVQIIKSVINNRILF
jgi:hypothetical protein